ncbi:histidine protein methyltransferase 1 homolog [Microplitis demolitor]|uniref:histidine protein methyltransferase 1 homolog n=1 Tax=Microplitis demolitor TaxID=69319 RepID=UPI00235B67FE|nr:histidine protein methyltransferase 1 homolog [Microplitis demolitor]
MFKFCFSEDKKKPDDKQQSNLTWFPATKINVTDEQTKISDDCLSIDVTEDVNLKVINVDNLVLDLNNDKYENIIKAESQHSDLLPAVYEGGLKIWECSFDLIKYLNHQDIDFKNLKVLDLGCGAGIVGIFLLSKGSTVHFQDYNNEVIQLVTIPNVALNISSSDDINKVSEFYSGDWESFGELLTRENNYYDLILSCETIYNTDNHKKLYEIFKRHLKPTGVGYVAGKTYYFGVGGNMREFENLIKQDNKLRVKNVWKSEQGLQREILKLTH